MTNYELTYLISADLTEEKAKELVKKVEEAVSKVGKTSKAEPAKKIRLMYPIKKKSQAFLAVLEIQAEPEQIIQFKNELDKMPEILRFLIIKKEPGKPKPKQEKTAETPKAKARPEKEKTPEKPKPRVEMEEIEKELAKVLKE